jgi:polyhydroxyalkanoate synthesis repressor PhaR
MNYKGSVMPHVIKRYANRKLYDSQAKRYVTLEELATLLKSGVQVQVIDNRDGSDITEMVLSKVVSEILSESARKEKGSSSVSLLSDIIQRPSDAVKDYVARAVKDVEEQLQSQWKRVKEETVTATSSASSTAEDFKTAINRMIEESVRFLINRMNLPTRSEINNLSQRLEDLEKQLQHARKRQKIAKSA